MKTKSNAWSHYRNTNHILDLTKSFNQSYASISPPEIKVEILEKKNRLKTSIILFALMIIIYFGLCFANYRYSSWDYSLQILLIVLFLNLICKIVDFFDLAEKKKYIKKFENLVDEFSRTFTLGDLEEGATLEQNCKIVLIRKAEKILRMEEKGDELRPDFNRALDLLALLNIIKSENDLKKWYKEAFEKAQEKITQDSKPSPIFSSQNV